MTAKIKWKLLYPHSDLYAALQAIIELRGEVNKLREELETLKNEKKS